MPAARSNRAIARSDFLSDIREMKKAFRFSLNAHAPGANGIGGLHGFHVAAPSVER